MAMNSSIDDKNMDAVAENASEESGWTAYLEDFSCNNNSSFMSSSSLVSDAAWNGSKSIRRLKFNKVKKSNNRRYTYDYDDDLEDTASSPVNSPKVSTMKQMEVNHRRRIDDVASCDFLGHESSSNNLMKHDREERMTNNVIDDNKNVDQYLEELRKRGLCVVPMAAFMNYIG